MLSKTLQLYKAAYSGLSQQTLYLAVVMLINRCGTMVLPFMSIYCTQQLHFNLQQTGFIMACFGYLITNFLPPHFAIAVACVMIITLGEIFALPFMNSYWLQRTTEENRGSYAALYTTAWSIATIAAPVIGSLLAAYFGFIVLWYVIAAFTLFIAIGTWFLQKAD